MSRENGEPPIEEWVEKYEPELLGAARHFETVDMSAEDIVQEVWIVAIKSGQSLLPEGEPGAWLYQILLNLGRTEQRMQKRRERLLSVWSSKSKAAPRPPATIPEELEKRHVWREMSELPQMQQRVFLLRFIDGFEPKEIAEMIGSTRGAVRTRIARTMKTLRKRIGNDQTPTQSNLEESPGEESKAV